MVEKFFTISNKYGHSIGYTLAKELETEMTYAAVSENRIIPSDISVEDGLCTNVAYDNYDRFSIRPLGKTLYITPSELFTNYLRKTILSPLDYVK